MGPYLLGLAANVMGRAGEVENVMGRAGLGWPNKTKHGPGRAGPGKIEIRWAGPGLGPSFKTLMGWAGARPTNSKFNGPGRVAAHDMKK